MLRKSKSRLSRIYRGFLSGKKILLIVLGLIAFTNAQGITNTLGGSTSADKFIVENNSGSQVLTVTGEGNVGIGNNSPTYKLDIAGKIGINGTQTLHLPDQSDFEGTIILGNGGYNLSHSTGSEGQHNIAIGMGALEQNTTGSDNIFIGHTAGQLNTDGRENTFIGWGAGSKNISGIRNSFFGNAAGYNNTGSENIFIGSSAGQENSSGNKNIFIGNMAGLLTNGADNNIFIGYRAGYSETGSNKLYIENSNSSTPLIGGDFSTDRVGINTATPRATLEILGTDAVIVPIGTTTERPGTLTAGMIRFNSTTSKFEGYIGTTWVDLH